MVHRSLSRSDFDFIRCGERGRHIILGAHRLGKIETLCQAGRDRRSSGNPCRGCFELQSDRPPDARTPCALEEIHALRAAAVAAFDEHCLRSKREKRSPCSRISPSVRAIGASSSVAASGRLGVTTSAEGIACA